MTRGFHPIRPAETKPNPVPPGAPPGNYAVHHFPEDMPPSSFVLVDLRDRPQELTRFRKPGLQPDRKVKVKALEQRTTSIRLEYAATVRPIAAYISLDTSIVFTYGRLHSALILPAQVLTPRESTLTTYFESGTRRKIIHACFFGAEHPPSSIIWCLSRLTEYYAVDTNTRDVPGIGRLSVTVVLRGQADKVTDDYSAAATELVQRQVFVDVVGNPERFALAWAVRHLAAKAPPESGKRIGIITDTELSLLRAINFRRQPLHDDYFLPSNFVLLYATADTGATEYVPNMMIRECDSIATSSTKEVIEQYRAGERDA